MKSEGGVFLKIEIANVQPSILQSQVHTGSNRLANARDGLPGDRAILVAEIQVTEGGVVEILVILNRGETDASTDVTGPAFLIAKVEQSVDHAREDRQIAIDIKERAGDRVSQGHVDLGVAKRGTFVGHFGF
jgi:hypothetical protein